jgi:hypothetical protein
MDEVISDEVGLDPGFKKRVKFRLAKRRRRFHID